MNIGIIGSGNIGGTLARYLTNLGHQVIIANSRGPESLREIAAETGANPVTAEEAAGAKDLVIIAIPEKAIVNLPIAILAASKAIIVDAGNYYPSRDGQNADIEGGLTDSEWVASVIGHPVIKAFNNIFLRNVDIILTAANLVKQCKTDLIGQVFLIISHQIQQGCING